MRGVHWDFPAEQIPAELSDVGIDGITLALGAMGAAGQ